jgi:hypothetical protein
VAPSTGSSVEGNAHAVVGQATSEAGMSATSSAAGMSGGMS